MSETTKTKQCKACNTVKPTTEFHSSGFHTNKDGSKTQNFKPDCKVCANARWRMQYKDRIAQAVSILGRQYECERCGYDTCTEALDFHHVDPTTKEFTMGEAYTASVARLVAEISKCNILCCRCHREYHAGVWQ